MRRNRVLNYEDVWDENDHIISPYNRGNKSDSAPHGRYYILRENGKPQCEITYQRGVVHGPYIDFWANGEVSAKGNYEEGKQEGVWHFYGQDGKLREVMHFKAGKEVPPLGLPDPGEKRNENKKRGRRTE